MRFRRGGFRGTFRRSPRPQTIWFHQASQIIALTSAAPLGTTAASFFSGSSVDAGLDQRLTMLRMRIRLGWALSTVIDTDLEFVYGIIRQETGAPSRNPAMTTAASAQGDWMHLGRYPLTRAGGVAALPSDLGYPVHLDIKSKRKLEENENIIPVAFLQRGGGAPLSAGQAANITTFASVLFQRTSKR